MSYLLVFIGGGLGSCLRHAVNVICPRFLGTNFPYHTFIINITGSTIMGLVAGYLAFKGDATQSWRLFLMTGILGGYTTFSAYSLDSAVLYERGEIGLAALYVVGSVVLSILGLFAGRKQDRMMGDPGFAEAIAQFREAMPGDDFVGNNHRLATPQQWLDLPPGILDQARSNENLVGAIA